MYVRAEAQNFVYFAAYKIIFEKFSFVIKIRKLVRTTDDLIYEVKFATSDNDSKHLFGHNAGEFKIGETICTFETPYIDYAKFYQPTDESEFERTVLNCISGVVFTKLLERIITKEELRYM
jgi:hypothetical protein